MLKIKVADIVIEIDNRYQEIENFCSKYRVAGDEPACFRVSTSPEENENSKRWYRAYEEMELSDDEAERDQMQHRIYPRLPEFDAFWLHACVVEKDGEAYAFTAPSGFGKTTHARLWKQLFGDKVRIINGDNPVITMRSGRFLAWGTPWCGKEGWSVNTGVPLKAVCYIKQSENNRLEQLDRLGAYARLIDFSRVYQNPQNMDKFFSLYECLVERVPFYQMNCNMELEAARISYEGMSGKRIGE